MSKKQENLKCFEVPLDVTVHTSQTILAANKEEAKQIAIDNIYQKGVDLNIQDKYVHTDMDDEIVEHKNQ